MRHGAARLPKHSFVAPIFYRLGKPENVYVEEPHYRVAKEWVITSEQLYEYVPEMILDCSTFALNGKSSETYYCTDWPAEYWASCTLSRDISHTISGRVFIGFLLFVGDLRPY